LSIAWLDADWPAPPNIHAGTTLRQQGASSGVYASLNLARHVADDVAAVTENRRRFVADCGLPSEPVWLQQTHSTNVSLEAPRNPDMPTDGLITRRQNTVCVILSADCLPVVFAAL